MFFRNAVNLGQHVGGVKAHAARTLHQRLDNHPGKVGMHARQQFLELGEPIFVAGNIHHILFDHRVTKRLMHGFFRVRHRHRPQRIAMIAVAETQETVFKRLTLLPPILQRHLQRHLDGHRPRIGKKHPLQSGRSQRTQTPRQCERRCVDQPAEHHMRHRMQLRLNGGAYMRMIITVARRPPRGDTVDQHPPVGKRNAATVRTCHRQRRIAGLHLRIG